MVENVSDIVAKYEQMVLEHLRFEKEIEERYHISHFYMENVIYRRYFTVTNFGINDYDWNKLWRQINEIQNLNDILDLTKEERDQSWKKAKNKFLAECKKGE